MDHEPLKVEVVAADRQVWSGDVINIIARTTEGDIGVLPGHEPLMAALVPCVVEIVTSDGRSETLAVDGGFISVAEGHVWILSQTAVLGQEVTLDKAERELTALRELQRTGNADEDQVHRVHILDAQIRAGQRVRSA